MILLGCILVLVVVSSAALNYDRTFLFRNQLNDTVWMGCLGNKGHQHLNKGGWILGPGKSEVIEGVSSNWAGRFWARTYCNSKTKKCETGDCGKGVQCDGEKSETPVTFAEFSLDAHANVDYYDISLVDGFNVKMAIETLGIQKVGNKNFCGRAGCDHDFTEDCPLELRQIDSNNKVVACKSACRATGRDDYCCYHHHSRPSFTCQPTSWQTNYAKFFKDRCPDAYSYAHDHDTTFHCAAPTYQIIIG